MAAHRFYLGWTANPTNHCIFATGRSADLLAGGGSGAVSVFGTEIFDAPPNAARVLAVLPRPAEAHLTVNTSDGVTATADMAKNDRESDVLLDLPPASADGRIVELRAAPGQAFILRPLPSTVPLPERRGHFWFGVAEPANGGDEAPAAAILLRASSDPSDRRDAPPEVLATPGVPMIASDQCPRTRFNFRGSTSLLFQASRRGHRWYSRRRPEGLRRVSPRSMALC